MTPTIGREMAALHRKLADLFDERENLREACAAAHREVGTLSDNLRDAQAEVEKQRASIVKLETEMWGWVEVCEARDEARARADKAEARVRELEQYQSTYETDAMSDLDALTQQLDDLRERAQTAEFRAQEAEGRVAQLERACFEAGADRNHWKVVGEDAVAEAARLTLRVRELEALVAAGGAP